MLFSASIDFKQESVENLRNRPKARRLRGYAFDPSLSLRLETASINHRVFEVPWEVNLKPGPRGEYVDVIDYDPASGLWYEPVDLGKSNLLAQDGLAPSESDPQFHQQMVYAVAMSTISNFERALGRQVIWVNRDKAGRDGSEGPETYVPTLRIYPHALRAANAYFSPDKHALLFGYFGGPSGTVFTCLSHDIVAHETTHALLNSLNRRYVEDNHPDTLAFHEAFADLVALFQHFTFPEVLRHQIDRTRGNLETQSLLGELAQQFGEATGRYGALRGAIGEPGPDGVWRPITPDPNRLRETDEPHARGSILVAAMFSAFLSIYKVRTRNIIALASAGSGILPEGTLHPSLVDALASQATKTARHFLHMAIRALDYCPPFDITFGDYLRALITADYDMVPDDHYGYRVALIESFRRWGIVPEGLKTLSEEQLRWPYARLKFDEDNWNVLADLVTELKGVISESLYMRDRETIFDKLRDARRMVHQYLHSTLSQPNESAARANFEEITGLNMTPNSGLPGLRYKASGHPSFEVSAVQPTLRVTPDRRLLKLLVISVTQRLVNMPVDPEDPSQGSFDFRGGSTLVFDLEGETPALRYAITRPISDTARLERVQAHRRRRNEASLSLRETYFSDSTGERNTEPFCLLHAEHGG